jgi:hypothetical protein
MSFTYDHRAKLLESPKNFPTTPHHLVILWERVNVDDGHGGTDQHQYARVYVFADVAEWEKAVKELALDEGQGYPKQRPMFMAYKNAHPAIIAIRAEVTIG